MRSDRPSSATVARARATESASNSTPTSSSAGKRRAIATSQRPPPQWTSTTRPPRDRSATSCGSAGQDLLEEHRDVLAGEGLDGLAVAVGPLGIGRPGPEEVGHAAPVHRGDDRVDELAAEEIGAVVIEQDRSDVLVHHQAAVLEGRQVVGVRRPGPGLDGLGMRAGRGGQLGRRHARLRGRRARARTGRARCPGRRATSGGIHRGWRSGRRSGRRGPSRGLSHGARHGPPGWRGAGTVAACNGCAAGRVQGLDGHGRPPRRRPRPRPRRRVRCAGRGPPGPAVHDRPAHARRSAGRRGGGPGRPRPGLPGPRGLRRGPDPRAATPRLADDDRASTCVARGAAPGRTAAAADLARHDGAAGPRAAPPRREAPPTSPNATPSASAGRRASQRCRPPTAPPSCSATSTACPTRKPPPPSVAPRAPSRPRSTGGSPCYARCSRPRPVMSSRR